MASQTPSPNNRRIGRAHAAFTLVELLVVVAIIAILAAVSMSAFINYSQHQRYLASVVTVSETLREARSKTLSSHNDTNYGVHFASSSVTLFIGDAYVANEPTNEEHRLDAVRLVRSLSGGTDEVIFSRRTGTSTASGYVRVESLYSNASTTIEVHRTGIIQ